MKRHLTAMTCVFSSLSMLLVLAGPASAANTTFYADLASFSAAVGSPLQLQDFEGFAPGTDLFGVPFLPGISATTNLDRLEAFAGASGDTRLFGLDGRALGNARYDIQFALPYTSIAFDIEAFEADPNEPSTAQGPGVLTVNFADSTSLSQNINGNPNGDPIFVGLVSDTAISSIRWAEALEGNGGNEETSLDDFRAVVPEPGSFGVSISAVAVLALSRRRRAR